jgi:hypothetical protein
MQFRGGMNELMRQANRVQRKIEKRKEELATETFEASAGNGQVSASANGKPEIVKVSINAEFIKKEELATIEDVIVAAVNAALSKSREHVDAEIAKISGGLVL